MLLDSFTIYFYATAASRIAGGICPISDDCRTNPSQIALALRQQSPFLITKTF
jgi:hypothetical protein